MESPNGKLRRDFGKTKEDMSSQIENFEKLCKIAREYRLTEFKVFDIEAKLEGGDGPLPMMQIKDPGIELAPMPTEDEMLLWSTNSLPDKESK